MPDADEDLVAQSKNGDSSAFEALVRKHQHMVHALTYRMTGSMADAEDLAQEAFLRAYERLETFGGSAKFSTWLCSIAIHGCLNWRRDEARRSLAHAGCAAEMAGQRAGADIEDAGMAQETQAALMRLPAHQRAAIVLTIYDGLSHAAAARIMHCAETTISWRVFAAKRKLKCWLSGGRTLASAPQRKKAGEKLLV